MGTRGTCFPSLISNKKIEEKGKEEGSIFEHGVMEEDVAVREEWRTV